MLLAFFAAIFFWLLPALPAYAASCADGTVYIQTVLGSVYATNVATGAQILEGQFLLPPGVDNINPLAISASATTFYAAVGNNNGGVRGRVLTLTGGLTTYSPVPVLQSSSTGTFIAGAVNPLDGRFYFGGGNNLGGWDFYSYDPATPLVAPQFAGRINGLTNTNGDFASTPLAICMFCPGPYSVWDRSLPSAGQLIHLWL